MPEQNLPVKSVPEGYHTVSPFMIVDGAQKVLNFLIATFDAEVRSLTKAPANADGSRPIMNVEVRVGTSMIMLADARENVPPMPTMLYIYVEDVDAVHAKAIAAGGEEIMPPTDMFYGDRHGGVMDSAGNTWWIASHIEDLTGELQRRADQMHASGKEE